MKRAEYSGHGSVLATLAGAGGAADCPLHADRPTDAARDRQHTPFTAIRMMSRPRRLSSVDPLCPHRHDCATLVTLDVELNRATADLAIFHVRRLVCGQVDAGFQPLTAIRTQHSHELLRRQTRTRAGLPYGLQAVKLVDAVAVQLRYAAAKAGQ